MLEKGVIKLLQTSAIILKTAIYLWLRLCCFIMALEIFMAGQMSGGEERGQKLSTKYGKEKTFPTKNSTFPIIPSPHELISTVAYLSMFFFKLLTDNLMTIHNKPHVRYKRPETAPRLSNPSWNMAVCGEQDCYLFQVSK